MMMLLAALAVASPPAATAPTPAAAAATPSRTIPSAAPAVPRATMPRPAYGPTTAAAPRPTSSATAPTAAAPRPATPQTAAARAAQVLAAVRTEFPRYDTRRTGRLSPLEFSTWVLHANGVAVAPAGRPDPRGIKPVDAMNATARAFAAADANHDGGVTADEMAAFLTRRPAATAAR